MAVRSFKNHRVVLVHETDVDAYRASLELAQRLIRHDLDTDPDLSDDEKQERLHSWVDLEKLIIALERSI